MTKIFPLIAFILIFGYLFWVAPSEVVMLHPNDVNSGWYLNYGRNLNRYPFSITHFMNVDLVGPYAEPLMKGSNEIGFYTNHPPLLTWATAAFLKIGGENVKIARLTSIISSSISGALLTFFAIEFVGIWGGIFMFFGLMNTPVFWHHGFVINFEPLCLASILLFWYALLKNQKSYYLLGSSFLVLGCLSDWPFYFVLPFVLCLLVNNRKEYFWAGIYLVISTILFILTVKIYSYFPSNYSLIKYFDSSEEFLLNKTKEFITFFPRSDFMTQLRGMMTRFVQNFFISVNFFFPFFIIFITTTKQILKEKAEWRMLLISLLGVFALNMYLFRAHSSTHSFWSYYFVAPLALGYALTFKFLFSFQGMKRKLGKLIVFGFICLAFYNFIYIQGQLWAFNVEPAYVNEYRELKMSKIRLWAHNEEVWRGHGFIDRWYWDMPLLPLS